MKSFTMDQSQSVNQFLTQIGDSRHPLSSFVAGHETSPAPKLHAGGHIPGHEFPLLPFRPESNFGTHFPAL